MHDPRDPHAEGALLRRGGGAALGLAFLPQPAACGGGNDDLVFSSWPEYIDYKERTNRFAHPAEGHIVWTDNLCIPVGAPHGDAARRLIDFYYQPEVHAALTRALF